MAVLGINRRRFLFGSAALAGAGVFGVLWSDRSALKEAHEATLKPGEAGFSAWLKIAPDGHVTAYSPTIDMGQGTKTAQAQMMLEELDLDWPMLTMEQAPALPGFANSAVLRGFMDVLSGGFASKVPQPIIAMIARSIPFQITGGSTGVIFTGQQALRKAAAGARAMLVAEAAARLGVPGTELATAGGRVLHAASNRSLGYGELAEAAAERDLPDDPPLKPRKDWRVIGTSPARLDVPGKVDGSAQYGIDIAVPDMRVATLAMAPVHGGQLLSVDPAPAMAVKGVEKVIKLDDAVVVVANGYWPAFKGLNALSPRFSDGGHGSVSSDSLYAMQEKLLASGKSTQDKGEGDVEAVFGAKDARLVEATYRVPFLHQMMMEPFAMTAHHHDGKLDVWVGLQDPLAVRHHAAKAAGLADDDVTVHTTLMGGGFGRRNPDQCEIIQQAAQVAMQCPFPVKLIWSREQEVAHGAYRGISSGKLKAALSADGKVAAWRTDYAQVDDPGNESELVYPFPAEQRRFFEATSNMKTGYWRSVNANQQGFYVESFMDELAHAAGEDPYKFRRRHLKPGSRALRVLDEAANRAGWGTPPPASVGRGIALVECFGSIACEVVEASVGPDGTPKVHKLTAVVDCGTTVHPRNAAAQIMGGAIMGLSAALGEAITVSGGAVEQTSYPDYPVLKLADAPPEMSVHFIESDGPIGGIGETGLPAAAPALANALFALTGKRIRQLPILQQAMA